MTNRTLTLIGLFFALAGTTSLPLLAQADPGWIGKRVVPKKSQFTLLSNGEAVERNVEGLEFYRVEQVDGASLLLRPEVPGPSGWASSDDVVALDQALDFFTQRIRASPADAFCRGARAFLWCDESEFDKAVTDYDEAIKLDRRSAPFFRGRGLARHFKGSYDQAIADFDEAIRLDPKSAPSLIGRGASRSARREFGKAIADFSEAIWLDPLAITAYEGRGRAWFSKKEFAKAIVDFNRTIQLDPRQIAAYCNRGDAWIGLRKFDRAIADFNVAIQFDARCARAYAGRASIWSTCPDATYRDGKKAVASATKACELTAWNEAHLLGVLAAAYAEAGDFNSAVDWQRKANALDRNGEDQANGQSRLKVYQENKPVRDSGD
jgi:tetratricopeptide (TPR) repeat protein